jgi:hypothetical protein
MDNEREKLIELVTSQQVVNAEFYNALRESTPMLSKLMLEKFKNFLNDEYFTDLERQTMLMKFLESQDDIDVVKEILSHTEKCDCKDDYTKIIMEWTFHNSEDIVKQNLAKVDGAMLYGKKSRQTKIEKPADITEAVLQGLIEITSHLIDEGDDDA